MLLLHLHLPVVDEVEEEGQLQLGDGEGQGDGGDGGVGGDKIGQEGGGGSQDEPVAGNLEQGKITDKIIFVKTGEMLGSDTHGICQIFSERL